MTENTDDMIEQAQRAIETAKYLESQGHEESAEANWEAAERLYERAGTDVVWFDEDAPSEGSADAQLYELVVADVELAMLTDREVEPFISIEDEVLEESMVADPADVVDLSDRV